MNLRKRALSMILSVAMICNMGFTPTLAYAATGDTPIGASSLCEHYLEHTTECGYTEGTLGVVCAHEHTEACYTDELICDLTEEVVDSSSSDAAHTHTQECYKLVCPHENGEHDTACAYLEGTAGTPCTYECLICNPASDKPLDSGAVSTPSDAIKAVTLWQFVDPENSLTENTLALPGVSIEQQASFKAIVALLPTALTGTATGAAEPATVNITGWVCESYQQDESGNWPINGTFTFAATLAEGYTAAPAPTVTVELGGAKLLIGETGDFTVTGGTYGTSHKYETNTLTIMDSTALTISGSTTADKIVVADGVVANITLNGVDIQFSVGDWENPGSSAFEIVGNATCNLILTGNNTLKSGDSKAGLQVPAGATVNINGTGALNATGGPDGAGIGGGSGGAGGTITISGGTVTATGGSRGGGAAGIGGGFRSAGGTTTISGGTVTATSGGYGAGIGGGSDGAGGTTIISGGTVTATGTDSGAGIGGGSGGAGGTIEISGGTITATGGSDGAGIGGGYNGAAGTFSTGTSGNAFIVASSIAHQDNKGSWNGIIFEGNDGKLYGTNISLSQNATVSAGKTLRIFPGEKLTIPAGVILQNDGSIMNLGTIDGTVAGTQPTVPSAIPSLSVADGSIAVTKAGVDKLLIQQGQNYYTSVNTSELIFTGTTTRNTISITDCGSVETPINVTLSDLSIKLQSGCPFDMAGSNVELTLTGTNYLRQENNQNPNAGMRVPAGATLVIGGAGSLDVQGGTYSAGIGGAGSYYGAEAGGNITINGGIITATGGWMGGAGIGGGGNWRAGGSGGTTTINGGIVTAIGGSGNSSNVGAGIGGGYSGAGGTTTINGGTVTATGGGTNASGIGGGGNNGAAGTFSTGTNGNAFINASSISHQDNKANWNGVIFEGDAGKVYGSPTLTTDAEIPSGKTLEVESGKTLIVGTGVTLTNNGTITNNATITNNGTIKNNGTITGSIGGNPPINNSVVGAFTVAGEGVLDTDYSYASNTLTIMGSKPLTISGNTTTDKIVVQSGVTANITLDNVSINVSGISHACAFEIADSATCNLTLKDGTTSVLKSGERKAGLRVSTGATVTINGTGGLNATGGSGGAGIGGADQDRGAGAITINGGTVTATGGSDGAGIGGGYYGAGGTITISGGTVTATGGSSGAGIGGGNSGAGGTFSTGTSDNAFINASSIAHQDNKNSWNGVIFEGNAGKVYGTSVTLETDAEIPSEKTLEIESGKTLIVDTGVTLTNNGKINNSGTLTKKGTIDGGGSVNASSSVAVSFSDSTVAYGDEITITATAQKKTKSRAANDSVDFYLGDVTTGKKLGTSTVTNSSGTVTATLTMTMSVWQTSDASWAIGSNTITADFGGSTGLMANTGTNTMTVSKATRTISAPTMASKTDTTATLNAVTPSIGDGTVKYGYAITDNSSGINNWQTELVFSGLNAGATYYFFASVPDVTYYDGATSTSTKIVLDKTAQAKPTAIIDYLKDSLTGLVGSAAYSITAGGNATDKTAQADDTLAIDSGWFGKTITIVKKGNGTSIADSEAQSLAIPAKPSTPTTTLQITKAKDGITIANAASYTGCEFSKDSSTWNSTGIFSGLTQATAYTISVRVKAVANTSFASGSKSVSVTTIAADGSTSLKPNESIPTGDGAGTITNDGDKVIIDKDKNPSTPDTVITPPSGGDVTAKDDGTVTVPPNGTITTGNGPTVTLPDGGTADKDGNVSGGTNGSIIVGDNTITPPTGGTVTTDKDGKTELPGGSTVGNGDTTVKVDDDTSGGSIDKDGVITLPGGGDITVTDKDGDSSTITLPSTGGDVTVKGDGTVTVPGGSTVKPDGKPPVTVPEGGGTVSGDGNITANSTVTSVTVAPATVNIQVGNTQQLTAMVTGTNSPVQTVTWASSDSTVATVNASGLVTSVASGTTTITATSTLDTSKSGTAAVTVTQTSPPTTSYTISFDGNGGTAALATMQTGTDGKLASLPAATRSGSYRFDGWFTAASGGTQITTSTVFVANTPVYAHWTYTGGGSTGDGGSDSGGSGDSSSDNPTPPSEIKPDTKPPVTEETNAKINSDKDGNVTTNTDDKDILKAIEKAQKAEKENGIAITLNVKTKENTKSLEVTLSAATITALINAKVTQFTIQSGLTTVTFDLAALKALQGGDVVLTITKVDPKTLSAEAQKAIGNRPVFRYGITVGGKAVTDFKGGRVGLQMPYTLTGDEIAGNLVGVYVDSTGKVVWMENSSFDPITGTLYASTNHFSVFGVGYKAATTKFTDTAKHWAKNDIDFVFARGLLTGTSSTTFSPDTSMTRGMFVTALGRLARVDTKKYSNTKFTDVKADAYYAPYVAWANASNIVNGTTATTFAPDKAITRQEMAVMLVNYSKAIGYKLPSVHAEVSFTDASSIGTWAKDAVKQTQMAGILMGKSGNKFDPTATATRAEVSAMLRRFVELVVSTETAEGWAMNESGQWMYIEDGKRTTGKKTVDGKSYTFDQYGVTTAMPPERKYLSHIVKKGDSFWGIARKYKVNVFELARVNGKTIFSVIYAGDELKVPQN